MLRYLSQTGDRPVTGRILPPTLRYSLQRHLAIGKGDNLVRQAQHIAVQVCFARRFLIATQPLVRDM